MHKYGYFYLPKGRALAVAIANYINERRYSNAPSKATIPVIDETFLTSTLPVVLTPQTAHVDLAKAFARQVVDRKVYVYDYDTLVTGSPFSSYPSALEAIGVNKRSSAIKRGIDTGNAYLGRYTFYSMPRDQYQQQQSQS